VCIYLTGLRKKRQCFRQFIMNIALFTGTWTKKQAILPGISPIFINPGYKVKLILKLIIFNPWTLTGVLPFNSERISGIILSITNQG